MGGGGWRGDKIRLPLLIINRLTDQSLLTLLERVDDVARLLQLLHLKLDLGTLIRKAVNRQSARIGAHRADREHVCNGVGLGGERGGWMERGMRDGTRG